MYQDKRTNKEKTSGESPQGIIEKRSLRDKLRIRVSLEEGKEYPLKEVMIYFQEAENVYKKIKDYLEFLKYKEEKNNVH